MNPELSATAISSSVPASPLPAKNPANNATKNDDAKPVKSVSYTHLTLPTTPYV